jgi:hypothetical protein
MVGSPTDGGIGRERLKVWTHSTSTVADRPRRLLDNLMDRETLAGSIADRLRTNARHQAAEEFLERTVQRPVKRRIDSILEDVRARR